MAQENVSPQDHWQAEYEFWTKIIGDEVARLRWNGGFEPVDCHLYPLKRAHGQVQKFVGTTRICGRDLEVSAWPDSDAQGKETLKLKIRVAPRKHH